MATTITMVLVMPGLCSVNDGRCGMFALGTARRTPGGWVFRGQPAPQTRTCALYKVAGVARERIEKARRVSGIEADSLESLREMIARAMDDPNL